MKEIVSGEREGGKAFVTCDNGDYQEQNEESELLEELQACNTHLFRASRLIRQAAPTDPFAKVLSRSRHHFDDQFDVAHVGKTYPKLTAENLVWLQKRLGRAITQRRDYLRYVQDHGHMLATTADEDEDEVDEAESTTTGSESTKSDLDLSMIERLSNYEVQTNTKGELECPVCRRMMKYRNERAWRRHILTDLRPYVCTFPGCEVPYFGDVDEWFRHEMETHRVDYTCQVCSSKTFSSRDQYISHLRQLHQDILGDSDDEQTCLRTAQRPVGQIPAQDCPCCSDWTDRLREGTVTGSSTFDSAGHNLIVEEAEENFVREKRERTMSKYDDGLTEEQWLEAVDNDDDTIEAATARKEAMVARRQTIEVEPAVFKRHLASHLEQLALFALPIRSAAADDSNLQAAVGTNAVTSTKISDNSNIIVPHSFVHPTIKPTVEFQAPIASKHQSVDFSRFEKLQRTFEEQIRRRHKRVTYDKAALLTFHWENSEYAETVQQEVSGPLSGESGMLRA